MEKKKRTEISELGKFGLIERLMGSLPDDAVAVGGADLGDGEGAGLASRQTLLASRLLLEGVDFDLTYFPFRHLGHKAVTVAASDVLAMNCAPTELVFALGVSAKLAVEDLDEFVAGARHACDELGARIADIDVGASVTGFAIGVSAAGEAAPGKIVHQSGAHDTDLVCITRDLGAAYLGLHLLEREKRALGGAVEARPAFEGHEYLLERQLRPRARKDIIEALAAAGIVPTAMIHTSDGLASDVLKICRASGCGARIYLDRVPIARETSALATEMNIDPVVAALNGGDDHELLFTVSLGLQEQVAQLGVGIEIVGHITPAGTGAALVTPDSATVEIKAPGFN